MDKNIRQIMDIEKKAEDTISKAESKAKKIREKSQNDLYELKDKLMAEIEDKKEKRLKAAEKTIATTKQDILKRNEVETKKMIAKAEKNIDKAVDYVIESLKESA